MTALANLRAQKKTFQTGSPVDQWIASELARIADPAVQSAAAGADGVWVLPENTVDHTGGDFTLTISIRQADGSVETFTTAAIVYNAAAATIESAIDTAATSASVTGWTNGDITVAGGNLQTADVTLTFDGSAVTNRPVTVSMADSMTGGTSASPTQTQTTRGQTERAALSVLLEYGVITGSVPEQDAATSASAFTKGTPYRIPGTIVQALMKEAAAEDANNATYHSLQKALVGDDNDRPKLVETRVAADD